MQNRDGRFFRLARSVRARSSPSAAAAAAGDGGLGARFAVRCPAGHAMSLARNAVPGTCYAATWSCAGFASPGEGANCRDGRGRARRFKVGKADRFCCRLCAVDYCLACAKGKRHRRPRGAGVGGARVCPQGHPLEERGSGGSGDDAWLCDGIARPGGCLDGHKSAASTKGCARWGCAQCGFDLCEGCAAGAEHGTACLYRPTLADVAARVVAPRVKAAGGGCATLAAVLDRESGGDTAPVGM